MKIKPPMAGFFKVLFPGVFLVILLGIALLATGRSSSATLTSTSKVEVSNRPAFAIFCESYFKSMRLQERINDLERAIERENASLNHPGSDKLLVWLNKKDKIEKDLAMNKAQLKALRGQFEFARARMTEAERS